MYRSRLQAAITTYEDEYVVDMERGLYMHSKTMTPQQFTRYFRTNNIVTRPDLSTNWEKQYFFKTYLLGENLIRYKRKININQMNAFSMTSSISFFLLTANDIFGPAIAMTMPGISQLRQPGQLRYNFERQGIVDYVNKCRKTAFDYGVFCPLLQETKEEKINRIADNLRSKYLKKNKQQ